jgi:hypothetical protein
MLFGGLCELRIADESKICIKPLAEKIETRLSPLYTKLGSYKQKPKAIGSIKTQSDPCEASSGEGAPGRRRGRWRRWTGQTLARRRRWTGQTSSAAALYGADELGGGLERVARAGADDLGGVPGRGVSGGGRSRGVERVLAAAATCFYRRRRPVSCGAEEKSKRGRGEMRGRASDPCISGTGAWMRRVIFGRLQPGRAEKLDLSFSLGQG